MRTYGPAVEALLQGDRLPELGPGTPNFQVRPQLERLNPATLFPHKIHDVEMPKACLAGLWLHHDFLDESHAISQEIKTPTGSYWHGIMHRREPDAGNAAYWFRRVGDHPIFKMLNQEAQQLGLKLKSAHWDPFAFIEQCESERDSGSELELLLRKVQLREWLLLFDWCFHQAINETRR